MSKFDNTIISFLESLKEMHPRSIKGYKRKITVFSEYLKIKLYLNDDNYLSLLTGLKNDKVIDSIKYYVTQHNISFKIVIDNYFTAINSYFLFLSNNKILTNENFIDKNNFSVLQNLVNQTADELKLQSSKTKEPITDDDFEKLRKHCDTLILKYDNTDLSGYRLFNSAIMVKLLLFCGIKNKVFESIYVKDYNSTLNTISINGYTLHLPDMMSKQFLKFIQAREKVPNFSPNKKLFVSSEGASLADKNGEMFCIMQDAIGHMKAECVAKTAIINMLRNNIETNLVSELTGFSNTVYQDCLEFVKEENEFQDKNARNRILDSNLRIMEIYDIL